MTPGAKEYAALKADIKERGGLVPIERDERGNTLDGHHRLQICAELGIKEYPTAIRVGLSDMEKRAHVRSLNLNRRHLSQSQRRALIAEQLKDTPEKSNRQIAETLKVDDKTVGTVRKSLENGAEIPHHEKRVDKRGTMQPAKRSSVFATDKAQARRAFDALAKTPDIDLPAKN